MLNPIIDVSFDFRNDARGGDPDSTSPTLRIYHRQLWSKALPSGTLFNLEILPGRGYLYHNSELGEFVLTSDTVLPSYTNHKWCSHIVSQIPTKDIEYFDYMTYTIGGMMVFPGKQVDRQMTINGARGCNSKIKDRFDLTLECIRRYYLGQDSPLYRDLARYDQFFRLFTDFKGYVDFFLLQDLVVDDYCGVRFFTPTVDFNKAPLLESVEDYLKFKEKTIAFVKNRNARIAANS
jgi:hypothetical protein